ncbi:hypothetical protein [Reinekea thalattae]|nr:hypothetical protein [Reinekea thalattae]
MALNKTTQKVVLISMLVAAGVVWATNNVDQVNDLLGDKGWF